jgi:hypothetical protein
MLVSFFLEISPSERSELRLEISELKDERTKDIVSEESQ